MSLRYSPSKGENSWLTYDSETQAEVYRGISCQRKTFQGGHIWKLGDREEGGRGVEKEKQGERDWDEWPHLKAPQKYLHTFISKMCVRLMSSTVFWPGLSVSGMFHEPELVLQLQWRMPIYIPGVSFHYFYLHAAFSLPDRSRICTIKIFFTTPVTHKDVLRCWYSFLSVCFCLSCVCQIIIDLLRTPSYWQRISADVLLQENHQNLYFKKDNNST